MSSPSPSSSFRYGDSLTILGISIRTAVLCETISWLLIYRTSTYKSLRSSIDKASKTLDSVKSQSSTTSSSAALYSPAPLAPVSSKKSKSKKVDRVETSLKESTRDLSLSKFKSGAVVAVVLFVVYGLLNSMFEGKGGRQAAVLARVARAEDEPQGPAWGRPHGLLHGIFVFPVLD